MSVIRIRKNPEHPTRMVRDPDTGRKLEVAADHEVTDSPYWRRRLQSGDIVLVEDADGPKNDAKDESGVLDTDGESAASEGLPADTVENAGQPAEKRDGGEDGTAEKEPPAAEPKPVAKKQPAKNASKKK